MDQALVVKLKLTDSAASYLRENLLERGLRSYTDIKSALLDRYRVPENPTEYMRRLLTAYQRPTESARDFSARVEAISYKSYPKNILVTTTGEATRKQIALQAFLEGLAATLKPMVLPQDPKTMEEALRQAKLAEEVVASQNPMAEVAVAQPSHLEDQLRAQQCQIQELTSLVRDLSAQLTHQSTTRPKREFDRPNQGRSNQRCWFCSRQGHLMKNCRQRQQMMERRGPPLENAQAGGLNNPFRSGMPNQGNQNWPVSRD